MPSVGAYATVLTVVTVTTFAVLFGVRALAVRLGAVVRPDDRHVHLRPTPTLGGLAMLIGVLAGMFVAWCMDDFDVVFSGSTEPLGLVLALVVIAFVGAIDDLRDVSAPAKLAGIVLAASILVIAGIAILVLRVPFAGVFVLSNDWSYLLSVVWVIGMTNAINLIDGLDGLAAGIVAIAAATFFLYAHEVGAEGLLAAGNIGPLVAVVALGACLGFLPHNVHPARIFMGDVGALLLGLLMAASTMAVGGRTDRSFSGNSFFFFAPLLIPLVILGVPVIDTLFAIIRRARSGSGISTADKGHLHHRLMRLGHGHRRSVFILWTWTALLSGFVLWPIYSGSGDGIVPFGIAAILLSLFTMFHPGVRGERRRAARDEARDARRRAGLDRSAATGPIDLVTPALAPRPDDPVAGTTDEPTAPAPGPTGEDPTGVAGDRPRA